MAKSRVSVTWHGDRLIQRMRRAAVAGVNDTVDEARDDAIATHATNMPNWVNRTEQLEQELVSQHARPNKKNPVASFGTTRKRGFYGYFHELGTVTEMMRPFLRPAADRNFGRLKRNIRKRWLRP